MEAGQVRKTRVTITRDNYVLDGHHRWAATIVQDAKDNKIGDLQIEVVVMDLDIGTALSRSRDFQKRMGISSATMKKREYVSCLKKKKKKSTFREVPMDLAAMDASMTAANS
jgi:hypothetical protein